MLNTILFYLMYLVLSVITIMAIISIFTYIKLVLFRLKQETTPSVDNSIRIETDIESVGKSSFFDNILIFEYNGIECVGYVYVENNVKNVLTIYADKSVQTILFKDIQKNTKHKIIKLTGINNKI